MTPTTNQERDEAMRETAEINALKRGGWNYRIMRHVETVPGAANSETYYAIHEVYYDANDKITGWTTEPGGPFGDTLDELIGDLAWIATALAKPVLSHSDASEVGPARLLEDALLDLISGKTPHPESPANQEHGEG